MIKKIVYILVCIIILSSMALYLYMGKEEQLELMDGEVKGSYVYVSPVPNVPPSTESAQIRLNRQINNIQPALDNINSEEFSGQDLENHKMGI